MFKKTPASFMLVTENAYAVHDKYASDEVNPYHTMASTFWKSFRNELEFDKNYSIDLDSRSSLSDVLRYIFWKTTPETQFAVRDSLYVPRLRKKNLPVTPDPHKVLFDREASYLITGGTGGLAKILMDYLISRGARHLILISRSQCSNDTQAFIETARKKQQIDIRHYRGDASDFQSMEKIIKVREQSTHPLRGIFHLAGIIRDELMVHLSDEAVQEVLQSKMHSAFALHQLTKSLHLDLFVLFSSSASILGSRGQSNYVAANGFLDGLAHLRHQQGLPALAINWGAFHTTGMAAKNIESLQRRGLIPLDPESIDVLDVLLQSHLTQIMVCPIQWDVYLKTTLKSMEFSALVEEPSSSDKHLLTMLRNHPDNEWPNLLRKALCEIAAEILGLESGNEVGVKNDLFAMGMDSLMALEFRNKIHDKLSCPNLSFPIEYFINEPRVDKIAKNIANELKQAMGKTNTPLVLKKSLIQELPLCDFQYVFWVYNKMGYPYNLGTQVQIKGKLNNEYVYQALDFVVQQNSVFWLNFNKDTPIQTIKKQGLFRLVYEDISFDSEQTVLDQEFQNNILAAIPLNEPPLIRVYLYKINSDLHELHIIIPHIIVDGTSFGIFFDQFKQCYESLFRGKKMIHEPEQNSFLDYVKKNNHLYETNLKDKIRFWHHYNKGFKMLSLKNKCYALASEDQDKYLFHYPIDSQLMEQFIEWHRTRNINVSTGLIAACHLALYQLSHQKKIPFVLIHSGREGSQYNSVVGVFVEYKKINLTFNKQINFINFVKSIEGQFLLTAPYQKCSHIIKNKEFKGAGLAGSHYLNYKWNQLIHRKNFSKSKLHPILIDYLIKYFSWIQTLVLHTSMKDRLNQLFHLNMPLTKPERLRTLINITPSFFNKTIPDNNFANLSYHYPNHYSSENRPIGNRSLWILFSKDQKGQYQLSINGPLTTECKDELANAVNQIMEQVLDNEGRLLGDFIIPQQ
ncbi:SDR family NAD(P)-dependent oxidoreductase [Legionella wadsworthii]